MGTLTHKGYARIYIRVGSDIPRVEEIIKEMDPFEFDYLPPGMIAHYTHYPYTVYTGKFSDLDMDELTNKCWEKGIHIWVYDQGLDSGTLVTRTTHAAYERK